MAFFLSFTVDGKQVFRTKEGVASGLMKGAPVITHNSALMSGFTTDPNAVVEVSRLSLDTLLSDVAIAKMIQKEGNEAIKARLGWLDEEEAPVQPELAMVITLKEGKIKSHSFLIGGKSKSFTVGLEKLEGICNGIDTSKSIQLAVDFTAVQFAPGTKVTDWRKVEEMFKDCMSSPVTFAKNHIYARWRILEVESPEEGEKGLCLHFEVLPLEMSLDRYPAEMLNKFMSSSNLTISMLSIPLLWRKPNDKKRLFTTPCLVIGDTHTRASDGNVRLSMATIRDLLRKGRPSVGKTEHQSTVSTPMVFPAWAKVKRELFMQEEDSFDIISTGENFLLYRYITCWYS